MKKAIRFIVPLILAIAIIASIGWYLFVYDRDFTRDALLSQARYNDLYGNSRLSAMFYDMAYNHSGKDENVAIELANQYKADGNYTKAEYTLSNAINSGGTVELYIALCKTYVEQDKLLDAVTMLSNISNPEIKAQLDAMRPSAPTANYEPGFYTQYLDVALTSTSGTLYCTTDGEYPSVSREPYSQPITLEDGETTIYAISVDDNGLVSPLTIIGYTVGGVIAPAEFADDVMEAAIREAVEATESEILYTNELWVIQEFTIPEGVGSYEDLKLLPYVKSLTIQNHNMKSLDDLSTLTKLEKLDMTGSTFPVEDLAVIAKLPSLTSLTLADCNLSTIAELIKAPRLTYLDLNANTLRNLEPLSTIPTLKEINLKHNAVVSLDALAALTNLEKLDVSYNSLTTLAPIASCMKLNWLDASNNALESVEGANKLPLLDYISVNHNKLKDISLLAECKELTNLHFSSNEIQDISSLSKLLKLDTLDFSYNKVSTLPDWDDACTLRIIDGSYNQLTNIDNLSELGQIGYVYMDYNKIKSLDALADCYHLVQVNAFGNDIESVTSLTEHNIIVNYDPT